MLRTLNTLLAIRTSITVNLFIFYLRKLPLLGRWIKDELYAELNVKKAIAIIAVVFVVLFQLSLRFAYVGGMLYIPVVALGADWTVERQVSAFVYLLLVLSFIVAAVSSAIVLEPKREKFIAVRLLRMSPRRYMQANLLYKYVTFVLYLLPAMLLFGSFVGLTLLEAAVLSVALGLWRVFAEFVHLKLFERKGIVLIKQLAIIWSVILLGFAAAYLPLAFVQLPAIADWLLSWPLLLFVMPVGVYAAQQLARYPRYREAVEAATRRDDPLLDVGRMMQESQKKTVAAKDSDYALNTQATDRLAEKLQGYGYLNALFMARHRSLVVKPFRLRLYVIGFVALAGVAAAIILEERLQAWDVHVGMLAPFLALSMYFLTSSAGENWCKAMFYHCDRALLRYSFYRAAAFQHFRVRLGRALVLNLTLSAALAAALTVVAGFATGEWLHADLFWLWLSVLGLGVLFSVHHLFMYYIFQPYASELNMKNPVYFIINMIVSGLCGASFVLQPALPPLAAAIGVLVLLYTALAFVLVWKLGPRTFRVK